MPTLSAFYGIRPRKEWRVSEVTPLPDFRLKVRFNDGLEGIVGMDALVHSAKAGVFSALAQQDVFNAAHVEHGIDLAPDAMHAAIKATGKWVLS